jgi:hypothetical protein
MRMSPCFAAALVWTVLASGPLEVFAQQRDFRVIGALDQHPVLLGITFTCADCERVSIAGVSTMTYKSPPTIASVVRGSPADSAGIKVGDVLTHIDTVSITTNEGALLLRDIRPGRDVRVRVTRGGQSMMFSVRPRTVWYSLIRSDTILWRSDSSIVGRYGFLAWDSATGDKWVVRADSLLGRTYYSGRSWDSAATGWRVRSQNTYSATLAGLELSIEGSKAVKVTVVEPACMLLIEVDGTRIQVRSPSGCR